MSTRVRFEDEADAEYREGGRWYDAKQAGLGIEFFDEVDGSIWVLAGVSPTEQVLEPEQLDFVR